MIKYVFNDGPIAIKNAKLADPQKIGEAIADLAEARGGDVTPPMIVDAARDQDHVLHPHFEWDDASAAEKYRLDQARDIVRSIRIVREGQNIEPERAFVSIRDGSTSYKTNEKIRNSADLQLRLLLAADRELLAFQNRFKALNEICTLVQRARDAIKKKQGTTETRAAAA